MQEFKYMGTNITSLRLVDPDNLNVQVCTIPMNLPIYIYKKVYILRTIYW